MKPIHFYFILTYETISVNIVHMDNKYVKTKVKKLLKRIPGPKGKKYAVLGEMLHLTPRQIINLKDGKCKAPYYTAEAIDRLLAKLQ